MNKVYKVIFGLMTIGSLSEGLSIIRDPQYIGERAFLIPLAAVFVFLFGYLTMKFHKKDINQKSNFKL